MRWKNMGEQPVVRTPWFRLNLADVELPGGRRLDHYVFRLPPVVLTAAAQVQHLPHGTLRRAERRRHAGGILRVLFRRGDQRPPSGQILVQAALARHARHAAYPHRPPVPPQPPRRRARSYSVPGQAGGG